MIGKQILDLVQKPYGISLMEVEIVGASVKGVKLSRYHLGTTDGHLDIYYVMDNTFFYRSNEIFLRHFSVKDGHKLTWVKTPIVPSVTLKGEMSQKAKDWLAENWFGDESMAKEAIRSLTADGGVIFDYRLNGLLVYVDTNVGTFAIPISFTCPVFLKLECWRQ